MFEIKPRENHHLEVKKFELTRKIRATSALKSIPVILLTARENSSDKLAGLEAGANAYMKKGQFDQSGLLEIIKGLIGQ